MAELLLDEVDVQERWTAWKSTHSKEYETPEEEQSRFENFQSNLQDIQEHNKRFQAGEETYSKGLNQFADLTAEEFKAKNTLLKPKVGLFMKR